MDLKKIDFGYVFARLFEFFYFSRGIVLRRVNLPSVSYCGESFPDPISSAWVQWVKIFSILVRFRLVNKIVHKKSPRSMILR